MHAATISYSVVCGARNKHIALDQISMHELDISGMHRPITGNLGKLTSIINKPRMVTWEHLTGPLKGYFVLCDIYPFLIVIRDIDGQFAILTTPNM